MFQRIEEQYPFISTPLNTVSVIVLCNFLWLLLAFPIFTLPAATAGLFAVTGSLSRRRPTDFVPTFIGAMRRHWVSSTLVMLFDLGIGIVVAGVLWLTSRYDIPMGWVSVVIAMLLGGVALLANLYVWLILVTFSLPLRTTIEYAVRLAAGHLFWSLLLLVAALFLGLILVMIPLLAGLAGFSLLALLISWGAWRVVRRYVEDDMLQTLDAEVDNTSV